MSALGRMSARAAGGAVKVPYARVVMSAGRAGKPSRAMKVGWAEKGG